MLVILGCAVMLAAGVAMVVRWDGLPRTSDTRASWPRWIVVALGSGLIAGLLAAGAGGRLLMRLLALTTPDAAGMVTEGGATVGEITVAGTLGFFVFGGAAFGFASGLLYLVAGPLLPEGRLRGLLFGLLLLVLGATRLEPLRADNFDFNLLGPAWLAVGSFVTLVLFHGVLVAALERRLSRQPAPRLPLAPGRVVLAVAVLVALPSCLVALRDLL